MVQPSKQNWIMKSYKWKMKPLKKHNAATIYKEYTIYRDFPDLDIHKLYMPYSLWQRFYFIPVRWFTLFCIIYQFVSFLHGFFYGGHFFPKAGLPINHFCQLMFQIFFMFHGIFIFSFIIWLGCQKSALYLPYPIYFLNGGMGLSPAPPHISAA